MFQIVHALTCFYNKPLNVSSLNGSNSPSAHESLFQFELELVVELMVADVLCVVVVVVDGLMLLPVGMISELCSW